MKRISIGGGAYEERNAKGRPTGRFWARMHVNRRRTWKLLHATGRREAISAVTDAKFKPAGEAFSSVAELYVRSGCPTKRHKWKTGSEDFCEAEKRNVDRLSEYFKQQPISDIGLAELEPYHKWRTHKQPEGRKTRAVDKEVQTLSNVLNFSVFITKQIRLNPIHSNRVRFHSTKSHARDRMPESGDVVHQLAEYFFGSVRSEVFGWLAYFSMFNGCRVSELLRLRMKAKPETAGFITNTAPFPYPEHRAIYTGHGFIDLGRRSKQQMSGKKDGLNPECVLWPEFDQMLKCFLYWHATRYPDCEYYFPGMNGVNCVLATSFNEALDRACKELKLPHITPHGFRSFFATKLHRDGFRDEDIAEAMGDKTVALMPGVYRDRASGTPLSWMPSTGLPAWLKWRALEAKLVSMGRKP